MGRRGRKARAAGPAAFQDRVGPRGAGLGVAGRARGGPGAAAPGGGGGEPQPPCTSPSLLALQQPDFPEMMGRRRPMGARAALEGAAPGLGWGIPLSV